MQKAVLQPLTGCLVSGFTTLRSSGHTGWRFSISLGHRDYSGYSKRRIPVCTSILASRLIQR